MVSVFQSSFVAFTASFSVCKTSYEHFLDYHIIGFDPSFSSHSFYPFSPAFYSFFLELPHVLQEVTHFLLHWSLEESLFHVFQQLLCSSCWVSHHLLIELKHCFPLEVLYDIAQDTFVIFLPPYLPFDLGNEGLCGCFSFCTKVLPFFPLLHCRYSVHSIVTKYHNIYTILLRGI